MSGSWLPRALVLVPVLAVSAAGLGEQSQPPRTNVLVILIDDLGWIDTGAYGSRFYETPAIDRLAREGVRFTEFYAASPVCSPTRASLMTGKHPARLGITDWIGGNQAGLLRPPANVEQLPLAELSVGEAFRNAGYVTGYTGKWHLGSDGFMPADQGFMETRAVNRAGQPSSYFPPYGREKPSPQDVPDLAADPPGAYLTDRLTDVTLDFLDRHRGDAFFYVLSHYSVHTPLQAPEALVAKYREKSNGGPETSSEAFEVEGPSFTKLRQDHPTYAAMIEATDRSVARVLDKLDALGIAERTLVVFLSDNGGLSTLPRRGAGTPTSNVPLRSGKGWLYEGGIRAPLVVRGPGVTGRGRAIPGAAMSTDLYPTLLDLAGLPALGAQHLDGVSLAPAIRGGRLLPSGTLYWHFPHYHGSGNTPTGAIRDGVFKLHEWFEDGRVELYRLDDDPGERRNLAAIDPAGVTVLRSKLAEWRKDVGAKMPAHFPPNVNSSTLPGLASDRVSPPGPRLGPSGSVAR